MGIGRIHTTNQKTSLHRIQEMNNLLRFFMMNQATPHLGVLSSLMNNESSNRRRQLMMGTALIDE
jgi:hypothetical protein